MLAVSKDAALVRVRNLAGTGFDLESANPCFFFSRDTRANCFSQTGLRISEVVYVKKPFEGCRQAGLKFLR